MNAEGRRLNLLIAGQGLDFSPEFSDGFVTRHQRLTRMLAASHDVGIVVTRVPSDASPLMADLQHLVMGEFTAPYSPRSRAERGKRIASYLAGSAQESYDARLKEVVKGPVDAVITWGPWLDVQYVPLRRVPSIHFFEEDVWRMPDLASQTAQARAFKALEHIAQLRLPQPTKVVVIAPPERAAARFRYPRSKVETLPFTLDSSVWPVASEISNGDSILVMGVLVQGRNAEGLSDIFAELDRRPAHGLDFTLVSDTGLAPELRQFLTRPWIRLVPSETDVTRHYRRSRMALVPARRATGIKTTILQAWSQGTPVVAFHESAMTVPSDCRSAVASETTPAAMADLLIKLWANRGERTRLGNAGLRAHVEHFDESLQLSRLETWLYEIADAASPHTRSKR